MTIEEFYIKKEQITIPENLDFIQRKEWYANKLSELKNSLTETDKQTVSENEIKWQTKMQSSHN